MAEAEQYQLTGNTNGLLPADSIIQILSRLPVKSLCRFRCVSKPWRSLISDRHFVKVHLNKAFENEDVLHQRRSVICTDVENKSLGSLDLDKFLNYHNDDDVDVDHEHDGFVTATELAFVTDHLQRDLSVCFMSYCNGLLLCQLHGSELYLVNPATRKLKILPRTPRPYSYASLCGFGFDYSTDEHKVVCGRIIDKHGIEFCVYTLETNSWRVILDESNCYHAHERRGFHLNGDLHWLIWTDREDPADRHRPQIIMSLLLAKEEVREIPLPLEFSGGGNGYVLNLGVFRQWLCIVPRCVGEQPYNEFWVMKEYGVRESWTKMRVSIPYQRLLHSGPWTKSHDLMLIGERLVMYNFNDESFKNLSIRGIEKVGSVEIYFDSLVSLIRNRPKNSSKKDPVKWQRRVKKM